MTITEDPKPLNNEDVEAIDSWARKHITQFDLLDIIGIDRRNNAQDVFRRKAMNSGALSVEDDHWLEIALAPEFEARTGKRIVDARARVDRDGTPFGAVIEGWLLDDVGSHGAVLDITTTSPTSDYWHLPKSTQYSAQWQMFAADRREAWIIVLSGRNMHLHRLFRNEAIIDWLKEEATLFFESCIVPHKDPGPFWTFEVMGREIKNEMFKRIARQSLVLPESITVGA
jgi:hypothetical protein